MLLRRLALSCALALASASLPARAWASERPSGPPAGPVLASPPRLLELVAAELPAGTPFPSPEVAVVLAIDVAASGGVEAVRLERGAGEPFDGAALAAARRFRFEPGRLATGEPVPVTITFRLRISAPPAPSPATPPPRPVRFTGRLLERGTRRPLGGVPVAVRAGDAVLRTTTGVDGRFLVEVPAARFVVVAVPPGHERLEARIDARAGEERDQTFYLEQAGAGYEAYVRAAPVRSEVTREVLTSEEVAKVAGSQGDTLKAVLDLPGAARGAFGGGELILRGSAPGDSKVFVEGQEIPAIYHFGGLRSTVNPRFLDSVDFVPGNFAPDYGRATGGIIEVKLRDPASDLLRGQADVNLYDAGVSLEGPPGDGWAGVFAFHRSWIDAILSAVIPSGATLSFDTAPRYYDYQFIATKKLGDQALRLLYYGSLDEVSAILHQPTADPVIAGGFGLRTMFHAVQAELSGPVAGALRQDTSAQVELQQFRTAFGPQFFFDLGLVSAALRSTWTAELGRTLQLRAGLDATATVADIGVNAPQVPLEGQPPTPVSVAPVVGAAKRAELLEPALFAELRWEPLPGLTVLPGLRLDWYSQLDRGTTDPRLTVRWEAIPGTTLEGGIGLYQQPPTPQESDPTTGNPDLLAERSVQTSVGVEQRLGEGVEAHLTGFYKRLSDLVVANPLSAYDPAVPIYASAGTGRVYGLEFLLRAKLGTSLFGWIAYTYQRAFRTDGYGQPERRFDFDQPHILTALATWNLDAHWSLGTRVRLVSGSPYTPVTGSIFDAATGTYVPVYGAVNSARLPTFEELDVRVDRTWIYRTWRLTLYLDVENATNHANVEGLQYSADYSQSSYVTGLPILPILGLTAEW